LTDDFDRKAKGPAAGARRVDFPKINARPKAKDVALRPFYHNTSERWDNWVLAKRDDQNGTPVFEGYESAPTTDRRNPSEDWAPVPATGFSILPSASQRTILLVSTAPVGDDGVFIPRSQPFRVSPANFGKETRYRINYRRENVRLKAGDFYSTDGLEDGDPDKIWNLVSSEDPGPDISILITMGDLLEIRKGATGRRPRTESQDIVPLKRLELLSSALTCARGRITADMKAHEVFDQAKDKWGRTPRVTAPAELPIRLRTTVKGTEGLARSATGVLDITYGDYQDRGRTRQGITEANIIALPPPVIKTPDDITVLPVAVGTTQVLAVTAEGEEGFRWYRYDGADRKTARRVSAVSNPSAATSDFTFSASALKLDPDKAYFFFARAFNGAGFDDSETFVVEYGDARTPITSKCLSEWMRPRPGVFPTKAGGDIEDYFEKAADAPFEWKIVTNDMYDPIEVDGLWIDKRIEDGIETDFAGVIELTASKDTYAHQSFRFINYGVPNGYVIPGYGVVSTTNTNTLTLIILYNNP
jgi:hypothetical protein